MSKDAANQSLNEYRLYARERRLRSLLAGMLDGFVTIDFRGTIQDASNSCERLFGYHPSELVGRNISILMPEPHRSSHDEYLAKYRRTGESWILGTTREFEVIRRDGSTLICALSVSRVDVPGHLEPFFTGSFRDVTAHHEAEQSLRESERRFRAIFDQEFQYVGLLAPDGTLLEINRAALDAVDAERADVVERPFWETRWWTWSPERAGELREALERAARGEFVRYQTETWSGTGIRRIDFSLKPVEDDDGEVALIVAEGRDITELHLAQRRETSMTRALAAIGESASILAHEIKNPITAVNSALRAVSRQLGEDEKVVLEELVEHMQRLEHLIRRTLSFAKPLELRPELIDLTELAEQVREELAPDLEKASAELVVETGEARPLVADRDLLATAIRNLVRNAAEALEGGGTIRLRAATRNGETEIVVEDDGPGIADEIQSSLFQPYVTKKDGGTGIGLALVKRIAEEHDGAAELCASELGGAGFRLRLPTSR